MKNPERARELIAELKSLAENQFESHRIEVLERDLQSPPTVEIIDENHQKFDGVTYTKSKSGHYYKMLFIHQVVWAYTNGKIPTGDFVIHHKNLNPTDNNCENLELITRNQHTKIHLSTLVFSKSCPVCNKEFETNSVGDIYCSQECRNKARVFVNKCQYCGKEFEIGVAHHKSRKFCSRECLLLAKRDKNLSSKFDKIEICRYCGKEYPASERFIGGFCSKKCCNKYRVMQNLEERTCKHCGKNFSTYKFSAKKFCSRRCANRKRAENIHHPKSEEKY